MVSAMHIKAVQTHLLKSKLESPFGFSQFYYDERVNLLVEVTAGDGTTGWGECYGPATPIQEAIRTCVAPLAQGEHVMDTELIWHKVWQRHLDHARHGTLMAALSGVDMALWDLKGKLLEQPLYRLLGGARVREIPCYATGHYFQRLSEDQILDVILEEAHRHVDAGFRALKIKVGKNLRFDRMLIEQMRSVFPDATLMADANHAYSLSEATQIGRVLDANRYSFFEEPLAPHALEDYARLRDKLDIAIATGECEQTRFGFRRLIESDGVDIIQPDLAFCGGISEGVKIRTLANSHGVDVTPHAWGTWIGFAAALHFHAAAPPNPGRFEQPTLFMECDNSESPVRDRVFKAKVTVKDGMAMVPESPGLGVEVDREVMLQFEE